MTGKTLILAILIIAAVTFFTRLFPFLFFRKGQRIPPLVSYIGRYLPPTIITIILVYSFKSTSLTVFPHGLPELIAAVFVILMQLWRHNFLISILGGTLLYMFLVQAIFI